MAFWSAPRSSELLVIPVFPSRMPSWETIHVHVKAWPSMTWCVFCIWHAYYKNQLVPHSYEFLIRFISILRPQLAPEMGISAGTDFILCGILSRRQIDLHTNNCCTCMIFCSIVFLACAGYYIIYCLYIFQEKRVLCAPGSVHHCSDSFSNSLFIFFCAYR